MNPISRKGFENKLTILAGTELVPVKKVFY